MLGIDEELTQAGDNGRYQQLLLWLVFLPTQLPFGTQHYFQLLGSWTPDHWCKVSRVPPDDTSLYWSLRVAMVKEYKNTEFLHAQCFVNRSLNTFVISEHRKTMKRRFMSYRTSNQISKCDHGWYYNRSSLGDSNTIVTEVCEKSLLINIECVCKFHKNGE
ncbi:hypothetical protein AVEN_55135-1 [Araneus ventricosus]|uniref:Uncharacterized protein n=1 Tax=Araneus ventricosus TaxID=182803 RepID=A0A4Y2VNY5_ARAVE|nr:hypothetical protein AVEN_272748-1 [Araneus ventricosus]GBO26844.1 hypothetical protein AVEN_55135-1 [Araneus ventricosus]